jgi:hypothetical protein
MAGIEGCLIGSAAMLILCWVITLALPTAQESLASRTPVAQ